MDQQLKLISRPVMSDNSFKDYINLATRNEDLKSDERVLNTALDNIKEIKALLIDKEKKFCIQDQRLRASSRPNSGRISVKDSLRKRCYNLINHLVHYKCVIECLSGDVLTMESSLINDDEYIHLSLIFRDAELTLMQAIKVNQQRNEMFLNLHDEEAHSYLRGIEHKWRVEHQERRKLISRLIVDQSKVIIDKITKNLEQQQVLLNQRYQSINNLIKLSYNHYKYDGNINSMDTKLIDNKDIA